MVLEVCRVLKDAHRKLRGRKGEYVISSRTVAEGARAGASTFSAVPSSRRSKEHDAAMIAALLREVV